MTDQGRGEGTIGRGRAAGIAAAFLLSALLVTGGLYAVAARAMWGDATPELGQLATLQAAVTLLTAAALTWLFATRLSRLDATVLRWRPGGVGGFGRGILIGAAPAATALALGLLAGGRWVADGGTVWHWLGALPRLLALLGPAALAEEMVFRGLPLVVLAGAFGRWNAVLTMALLFGLAHGLNPGASLLAVGNVVLAGMFLGAAFYLPGGLWTATGAHLGWNLALAGLAAPVSGLTPAMPGLDYHPGPVPWLTGGAFGPEGGLLATATLVAAVVVVSRRVRKETPA